VPAGFDSGRGSEPVVVRRITSPKDPALIAARAAGLQVMEGRYSVRKYWGEVADNNLYEIIETAPNAFLTAGITEVLKLAAGQTATAFGTGNARLCVGDSATATTAGMTDLQGSNKFRQVVDSAPVVSTNSITFVATFGTSSANYVWAEVGVANASAAGAMWSRTVQALGTKSSAASWVLNWTLSMT
jgi:hypothetical protein